MYKSQYKLNIYAEHKMTKNNFAKLREIHVD